MKVVFVNGQKHRIPEDRNGNVPVKAIQKAAGDKNRQIVLQKPDGSNLVLPSRGNVSINPGAFIMSLMLRRRGNEPEDT